MQVLNRTTAFVTALLFQCFMSMSSDAIAAEMPYIGPQSISCDVRSPKGIETEIYDGGYLSSENCEVLFVKPPRFGSVVMSGQAETSFLNLCPVITGSFDTLALIVEKKEEIKLSYREQLANGRNTDRALRSIRVLDAEIDKIYRALKKFDEKDAVAMFSGVFTSRWQELVDLYKEANPHLREVRRLPIESGVLNASVHQRGVTLGILSGYSPLVRSSVNGAIPISPERLSATSPQLATVVKAIAAGANSEDSLTMTDAIHGKFSVNLLGACPHYSKERGLDFSSTQNDSYLSPTYTYVYPFKTKSFFQVEVDEKALKQSIMSLLPSDQGWIESLSLTNKILSSPVPPIRVTLDRQFVEDSRVEVEEYEASMTQLLVNQVLAMISAKSKVLVNDRTKSSLARVREGSHCHRFMNLKSSCEPKYYLFTRKRINWQKVKRVLLSRFGQDRSSSEIEYRTHYRTGAIKFLASKTASMQLADEAEFRDVRRLLAEIESNNDWIDKLRAQLSFLGDERIQNQITEEIRELEQVSREYQELVRED